MSADGLAVRIEILVLCTCTGTCATPVFPATRDVLSWKDPLRFRARFFAYPDCWIFVVIWVQDLCGIVVIQSRKLTYIY